MPGLIFLFQAPAGGVTHERAAALSSTATVASAGVKITLIDRSAAFSATAAVASAQQRILIRQSALSGAATITSARQLELSRQVGVAAQADVVSSGGLPQPERTLSKIRAPVYVA